ncbi:MAG TPA: TonB family protein [Chthoniobacterales bacterium]
MKATFGRLAIGLLLAGSIACGRKTMTTKAREPTSTPAEAPGGIAVARPAEIPPQVAPAFEDVAKQVRQAVVIVSVFNQTGHLIANGHGFFVSDDGKFVSDRSVIAGGVNAVAKAANGAIYNVSGALGQIPGQNLVLLKADAHGVPFLTPSASSLPDIGGSVAVVLSPVERSRTMFMEGKISGRYNDQAGEWFDFSPTLPNTTVGAPLINQRGELVGIVTLRTGDNGMPAIRPANSATTMLSQIAPNMIASWQTPTTAFNSPSALVSPSPSRTPTPPKIAIRGSKLLYAPAPRYPQEVRRSHWAIRGSGSFRVMFDSRGHAAGVQTVRSTGNPLLDESAVSALHEWRAQPGQEWSLVVPITFQP